MTGRCACGVRLDLVVKRDHWECRGEPEPVPVTSEEAHRQRLRRRARKWDRMTPEERQQALASGWLSPAQGRERSET
jgi:hypothetical protein